MSIVGKEKNKETISIDVSIIKDTPNNMELGKKIRKLFLQTLSDGEKGNTK